MPSAGWSVESVVTLVLSAVAILISLVALAVQLLSRRAQLTVEEDTPGFVRVVNVGTAPAWKVRARLSAMDALGLYAGSTRPDSKRRRYVLSDKWTPWVEVIAPGSSVLLELPDHASDMQKTWHRVDARWQRNRVESGRKPAGEVQMHFPKFVG